MASDGIVCRMFASASTGFAQRAERVSQMPAGTLIAVANTENTDYQLRLHWDIGSRREPLLCAAMRALKSAGTAEQRARWYARVERITFACTDEDAEITVDGRDAQLDDGWREGSEILWRCARHPMHDRVRIRPKFCKKRTQQRRPRHAPIMGPQRAAQRLAAEPSAASFVRNRPTPAADLILLPIELRPANAAGADHDDAAVAPAMCADAGRLGIGDENR